MPTPTRVSFWNASSDRHQTISSNSLSCSVLGGAALVLFVVNINPRCGNLAHVHSGNAAAIVWKSHARHLAHGRRMDAALNRRSQTHGQPTRRHAAIAVPHHIDLLNALVLFEVRDQAQNIIRMLLRSAIGVATAIRFRRALTCAPLIRRTVHIHKGNALRRQIINMLGRKKIPLTRRVERAHGI